MMHHLPPLSSPSFVKISVISIFCTRVPHCHFALILSSLLLLVSHFNLPPPHLTLHHLLHISHFFVVAHLASISPQICIRVSSQGLRLLCLLTCSSLSQVKSDPPSTLKACSIYSLPCPPFQVSGVLCLWLSLFRLVPAPFSARLFVTACLFM